MASFTPDLPEQPDRAAKNPDRASPMQKLTDALKGLGTPEVDVAREKLDFRSIKKVMEGLNKELKGQYGIDLRDMRNLQIQPNGFQNPLNLNLPRGDRFTNMRWNVSPLEQFMQNPRLAQFMRQTFQQFFQRPQNMQMPMYGINWNSQRDPRGGRIYLPYHPQILPPFSECNGGGQGGSPNVHNNSTAATPFMAHKPVIYLYPTAPTDVTVGVDLPGGSMIAEYPMRKNGVWSVHAETDGTLTDAEKKSYAYLFWEGLLGKDLVVTSDNATCVRLNDYTGFLETSLAQLGLNTRERNDFIVYWLPLMQKHPYALVRFCGEEYATQAPLSISPTPDTLIRVFMAFEGRTAEVDAKGQTLPTGKRAGFTAVEWGGTEITAEHTRQAK